MTTPFQPIPCDAGGGAGDAAVDPEQTLLCDVLPNGDVVGSALAVFIYDEAGIPTGPPTFVDPATGLPYVPQGVLQPCSDTLSHSVEILCDVNDVDGSSVTFERVKTIGPAGTVLSISDFGLDGAPYTPLNTVQLCDPHSTCTPDSNLDLNADCGPGESVTQQILLDDASAPLSNAVFNDDATADPLCGGTWDRTADDLPPGFPVAESFRNTTFDQPGPVTQANWAGGPFLTAGPPTNDGAGAGWIRLSDGSYASGGVWQVPTPFSTSQGMNAAVTLASHDGTTPGGDGQYFVFTDGSQPPQSTLVGGFGNLGLNNIDAGVFAVVLDEYGQSCSCGQAVPSDGNPGPCGFCPNTISIQRAGTSRVGASCACCTIASAPLAPKAINLTTRAAPLRLLTSVISEGGQTYVSASIDWNDGNGPIQYFDRVNITPCITVPPTLRMGLVMNSGGSFQAIKEARDAVARPAGVSNWRAFPITTDPIPACVTLVNLTASVDVTPTDDGTQTVGNGNPEAYFWLVNTATNTVLDRDQYSIIPSQLGQVKTLTVSASVPPADVANLRLYTGAESRDESGEYSTTWENLTVDATGAGCPATPRRTMEISARCPIPVAIVSGGGGDGGGGGTTVVNTPSTFEDEPICATVGGTPQTAFRREVRTPDGGVEVTFLGFNGLPITPDGGWVPGPCCCDEPMTLGPVCWVSNPPVGSSQPGFITLDADGNPVLYDTLGNVVPSGAYIIVTCKLITQQSHILCDAGNADHPFLRWYVDSPIAGEPDQQWDFELDGSTPYVPVGPVGVCDASTVLPRTADSEVLCDTAGPFLRTYTYDANGLTAGRTDTLLDGTTPYVPVSAVTVCDSGSVIRDSEHEILCDSGTNTRFVRNFVHDETGATLFTADFTLGGAPFVPTGIVGPCTDTSATVTRDEELLVLCDSTPTRFLRRYNYDGQTGAFISITNTTLDGTTPFAPVGAVGVCTTAIASDFDFIVQPLCDANGTAFFRRLTFNSSTGAVTSTTDTTLAGAAFVPVGAVGLCSNCCPSVVGSGCTNVGSGFYTAIRATNGTISLIDSVTGAAVLAANIVACPSDNTVRTLTAQGRLIADADAPWTPGADVAGTLTSVTMTILSGTATLTDQNGTVSAGLPAGYSATWSAEDDNTLSGPTSIDAIGGSTMVVWTQR